MIPRVSCLTLALLAAAAGCAAPPEQAPPTTPDATIDAALDGAQADAGGDSIAQDDGMAQDDGTAPPVDAPADATPPDGPSSCNPRMAFNPCDEGQICQLQGTHGVCVADCRAQPSVCELGWGCDEPSGICVDPNANGFGAPCGVALGGCDGVANGICIKASLAHGSYCSVPCAPFTTPCPADVPGATCFQGTNSTFCLITCRPTDPASCPAAGTSCVSLPGGIDACLPSQS